MMRMTYRVLMLAVLLFLLVVPACDDDDDGPVDSGGTIEIYGRWAVLSGADESYMLFNTDNTYDFLREYEMGFRSLQSDVFMATESQVMLNTVDPFFAGESKEPSREQMAQGPIWGIWNYHLSGDTLILWTPDDTVRALRAAGAPTADQWMPQASLTGTFPAPHYSDVDMTWHDGTLWYGNARASDYIYRVHTGIGAVTDSFYCSRSAYCLEWVDTNLWVSSNGYDGIYNIDTATNVTRNTISDIGAWAYGMAYDGTVLYVFCNNGRHLYRCNPGSNTILDSMEIPISTHGLTYDGSDLWMCGDGGLHRFEMPAPTAASRRIPRQTVTASYRIPGFRAFGIAYDGTDLWVSGYRSDDSVIVGKIVLPVE